MSRLTSVILLAAAALGCASCAVSRVDPPSEYLDPGTAATITVVREPFVFARARRDVAANAQDYVTLASAAVNRGGRIDYVMVVYRWSTVDARLDPDARSKVDTFVIAADDRRIELATPFPSLHEAGLDEPVHRPPGPARRGQAYRCDLSTLRYLAAARRIRIRAGESALAPQYELWRDGRPSLAAFVAYLDGAR